ncbi:MAG: hypothetical protein JW958_06285 [Candidatus Eisenbacteria bacterium]|nr:hypothetical protein [Candidatus Eisenbacteria bacterium]
MMRKALPVLLCLVFAAPMAHATPPDTELIGKKIGMMEKILDATLIDSKHALVMRGENTQGTYLEGLGAFFTLEFSFVDEADTKRLLGFLNDLDSLKAFWGELVGKEDQKKIEEISDRRRRQLDKIEEELVETIIDYGSSLSMIGGDESILLVAFPYSWDKEWVVAPVPLRHLTIRVRMKDLEDGDEGRIDEDELRRRVTVTEIAR